MCVFCQQPETTEHLFFNCNYSKEVWSTVMQKVGLNRFWLSQKKFSGQQGRVEVLEIQTRFTAWLLLKQCMQCGCKGMLRPLTTN